MFQTRRLRAPVRLALRAGASQLASLRRASAAAGSSADDAAGVLRPDQPRRVLLHSCCAPCSGAMVQEMAEAGHDVAVFFYNPNIHPKQEYEIRKDENKRSERATAPGARCRHCMSRIFAKKPPTLPAPHPRLQVRQGPWHPVHRRRLRHRGVV